MLQSQLGLLSSPIEQDLVSVVSAVDQPENAFDNDAAQAEMSEDGVSSTQQTSEATAVNILLPTTSEDDLFGFDPLDDCGIPKNAFASPKKPKSFRTTEALTQPLVEESQNALEKHNIVQPTEAESFESETLSDPLLSDELPTSLWQPRKPASVARTSVDAPSFSDGVSQAEGNKKEWKPNAVPPPVDDLAKLSSGKKRYERGNGRQEKSFDRKSREPLRDSSDRDRREHSGSATDNPKYRQPKTATPRTSFDDSVADVPTDRGRTFTPTDNMPESPFDSSIDDLAWEPKQISKGKDRKPGKSFRQADNSSFAFVDRPEEPESFSVNLSRGDDENDWLDAGVELEQAPPRAAKKHRHQKSSPEQKRHEPEIDVRSAFKVDDEPIRHSREERESLPRRAAAPRTPSAARFALPASSPPPRE